MTVDFPPWLRWCQRKFGRISVPYLPEQFAFLQIIGYILLVFDHRWLMILPLYPDKVAEGQFWRLFTFLLMPYVFNLLFFFFEIFFLVYILRIIVAHFSEFGTLIFLGLSIVSLVLYSIFTNTPLTHAGGIFPALIVTAGILAPEEQILFALFIPMRLKWLALITFAGSMITVGWYLFLGRFSAFFQIMLVEYGVVALFFYQTFFELYKGLWRKFVWKMKNRM